MMRDRRRGAGRPDRRLIAAALAAAPVAVALAVAVVAAADDPARDMPPGRMLLCIQNYPPPYPGHEEEVRAIAARGGEPGVIRGVDEYVEYFFANSRETPDLALRSAATAVKRAAGGGEDKREAVTGPRDSYRASPPLREPWDDKTLMMKAVTVINRYEAPAGPCVWEHEYIAWGGSLLDLEYDEGLKCYLAGNGTGPASCGLPDWATAGAYAISCFEKEPAPYELADEETRALVQRAGPAPNGSVLEYAAYLSPDRFSMTGPAPNGSVLEYVVQNTRMEISRDGTPNIIVAFALNHTGGDAYRAVKMLNLIWKPAGDDATGCVIEFFWVGWGNKLTDLKYSEEARCYLAPPEVRAKPLNTPCFP